MNYWGVEVKSGKALQVQPGEGKVLHLSQACLGEASGKGKESVCLFVNIDGQRLVLGTLCSGKLHQQLFDLVFEKDFELSHNWKNGSVYFSGYISVNPFDDSDEDSSSDEEKMLLEAAKIVKSESEAKEEQPSAAEVKITEPVKDKKPEESSDDSSSDESSSDELSD